MPAKTPIDEKNKFYFLKNNLFTSYTLEMDFPRTYEFAANESAARAAFEGISRIYDADKFKKQNEHQFEDDFIVQVLEILGYTSIRQDIKIIQGKQEKPDFLLFTSEQDKAEHEKTPNKESSNAHIAVILESKAYAVEVDNHKIKDNPHFQILRYISALKLDFGFLTNGRVWRFYDNSQLSSQKVFYEVNLEQILQNSDLHGFNYFYFIFRGANFAKIHAAKPAVSANLKAADSEDGDLKKPAHSTKFTQSLIHQALEHNKQAKITIEDDLQNVIYGINGRDSLFEFIGARIFAKCADKDLKEIYENALYFVFRLLFIAYFEDKFSDILSKHEYFADAISLEHLLLSLENSQNSRPATQNPATQNAKQNSATQISEQNSTAQNSNQNSQSPQNSAQNLFQSPQENSHQTYHTLVKLNQIFTMYDKGEPNYDMPIFNGGLFDMSKTPLLRTPQLFSDSDLAHILRTFFYFSDGASLFKRDYKTLSIAHLGTIYEGLLGYFFERASEDLFYVKYCAKGSTQREVECYVDGYDLSELQKQERLKKLKLSSQKPYKKGEIYLKNTSNSRKSTASFYTPHEITAFLVSAGLENRLNNENILRFKILDNACGSGHFLIEALNQITQIVLENFDNFPNLKGIYDTEKAQITQNSAKFIKNYELDESDILKRLLLKRVIFGVDLNPFSIELTKLSLWIDSFIFGTPLSFIEHHIKCGNALIGTSIAEFKDFYKGGQSLFLDDFFKKFDALSVVFDKLDTLKDSTEAQINESKATYNEIKPTLNELNLYLNYCTALKIATPEQRKELLKIKNVELEKLAKSDESDFLKARQITLNLERDFGFFNYEIAFPEIVQNAEFIGFDMIAGNPPWDKCEFSDDDFFPQFKSDYRTLKKSKKAEFKANQLAKDYILKDYRMRENFSKTINEYYKKHYFLSRSSRSKDLNLFRFFVEKNLSFLAKDASLNYVLPSALMFEDGSINLRKEILENKTLNFFYGFENRESIFNNVDSRYKFALMQIKNATPSPTHSIKTMFYKTRVEQIDEANAIELNLAQIQALSPAHLALQEVRSKKDLEILQKCYEKFTPLDPKWLDFRNELNMTTDRDLFIELDENLDANSVNSRANSAKNSQISRLLPLFEGKMIHQFNAHFSAPNYFLDPRAFDERTKSKEIYRLKQDLTLNAKAYETLINDIKPRGVSVADFETSIIKYDRAFFRLAFRDIARDTDEFSGIFSLLPKNVGCGNTMWVHIPKKYILNLGKICTENVSHARLCFALGLFNSLVVNFMIRGIVQIHLNKTYLERIPLPQPTDEQIAANKDYAFISRSALLLQLYNDKAGEFNGENLGFGNKFDSRDTRDFETRGGFSNGSREFNGKNLGAGLSNGLSSGAGREFEPHFCGSEREFDELKAEFNIKDSEIPPTPKLYDELKARLDLVVARLYGLSKDDFLHILSNFKVLNAKQPGYIALLKSLWE